MDFQSPADIPVVNSLSPSSSSQSNSSDYDSLYPSLENLYARSGEDDDFESETPSVSPSHKRYLYPQREFVEELRPEEIRWFYRHDSGKKWVSFNGYDSLRVECRYLALELNDTTGDIDETDKILARGGLYEVDVANRKCVPIYWEGEECAITRGTWFEGSNWQPMDEEYACKIEESHLNNFYGRRLERCTAEKQRGAKPVIFNLQFKDFHIDWNATDEVYKFDESTSSKLIRNVRQTLGWQKSGIQVHRGYCYESKMEDKPPDVAHLVFVIHGIGQKMDTGRIVRCTKDVRERVKYMRTKIFPEFDQCNKRAEFLPVQWRTSLQLDGNTVESITPHIMKNVRDLLNSSAMDILYYTSPLYRSEILQSLQGEITRLYQMFCARHPYFEANNGKVSILAHSLGSVITYDILTGWNPLNMYDELIKSLLKDETDQACGDTDILMDVDQAKNKLKDLEDLMTSIRKKQGGYDNPLPFKVENLFCIGSPLSVFLALRGVRPRGTGSHDHILPSNLCGRIFNIFHPSDPVVYRLEPLILKHYSTIMPLQIYNFSTPKKKPYSQIPRTAYAALTGVIEDMGRKAGKGDGASPQVIGINDSTNSGGEGKAQKFSLRGWLNNNRKKEPTEKLSAELHSMNKQHKAPETEEFYWKEDDEIDKTELEYRLDFQLKEQRMTNSYLSVLTSHTNYWTNKDVAHFILTHLHPELQMEEHAD